MHFVFKEDSLLKTMPNTIKLCVYVCEISNLAFLLAAGRNLRAAV